MRALWQCLSKQSFCQGKGSANPPQRADSPKQEWSPGWGFPAGHPGEAVVQAELSWQKRSKASPVTAALTPCHAASQHLPRSAAFFPIGWLLNWAPEELTK